MEQASITSEPATIEQQKQIRRLFEDAIDSALKVIPLDKTGAQRLIGKGNEIRDLVFDKVREVAEGQYPNEEVSSKYGYLSGYNGNPTLEANLADLEKELATLKELFPELADADFDRKFVERIRKGEIVLPIGAERWTLIPCWQKIAPIYNEAVQRVLDTIKKVRGRLYNYRENQIGPGRLRQLEASVKRWEEIAKEQTGHDILVVAVQLGKKHAGRSVRRAREVMQLNEFGLGAFAVGITILTHPERLQHYDDLWIDCAGDEYDEPSSFVRFGLAPCFRWRGDRVGFDTREVGDASVYCGSGSGFVPQQ